MSRKYTNILLESLEQGLLNKDTVIMACLKYMSESSVQDMAEINDLIETEELLVCPYCGDEKSGDELSCCGESNQHFEYKTFINGEPQN